MLTVRKTWKGTQPHSSGKRDRRSRVPHPFGFIERVGHRAKLERSLPLTPNTRHSERSEEPLYWLLLLSLTLVLLSPCPRSLFVIPVGNPLLLLLLLLHLPLLFVIPKAIHIPRHHFGEHDAKP
jgi:hypothetical protein